MLRRLAIIAVAFLAVAALWRPAAAWWYLDVGNLALLRYEQTVAASDFARGLELEPGWRALREDQGRALIKADPATALEDFKTADCGEPCVAEAGDAESRLGRFNDAVNDYLAAHAVERVRAAAGMLAAEGRVDGAITLERTLAARLGTGMLAQADVASAEDFIGQLDQVAAKDASDRANIAGYHADAIRSFRHASQLAPFNEGYLLSLGFSEAAWGDKGAARDAFERVLDLHPHESDAERGLKQLGYPGYEDPD